MIGFFDSGSGGLTVLRSTVNRMPGSDYVYFGDIRNAPYGSKSREALSFLTISAIERLQALGATSIVSACNSVSASLAVSLFDTLDLSPDRLIEMVGPTASFFRDSSARVLVCATPATIDSEIYQNAFHMIGKEITTVPVPELAGAIEEGRPGDELKEIIRLAFAAVPVADFDVLVLACTHYPLALTEFTEVLPRTIALFDPADEVAYRIEKRWWPRETGAGTLRFVISRDSAPFRRRVSDFFEGRSYQIEVVE